MSFYRSEIDGLRTFAVLSVILFHLGYADNGYLGVDVFFVISGFLITKIIYTETVENRFSIVNFYMRRIRRIIPLVLFINLVALIIGALVMLPKDLRDLGQSVVATNFFSNNILEFIVTKDYWDISTEFKPLMHTWSLGIEEQFYVVYPLIFMFFGRKKVKFILPVIIVISIVSLLLYFISTNEQAKFYLIQYRFFELALGGIGALFVKKKLLKTKFSLVFIAILIAILFSNMVFTQELNLLLVLLATLGLLITSVGPNKISSYILQNKLMTGLGKISFSLYMWHQLILAFSRYFILEEVGVWSSVVMFLTTVVASIATYFLIEQPFRNKKLISNKTLLVVVSAMFVLTTGLGAYLHFKWGVIKDVPELGIKKSSTSVINTEIEYNERVYRLFDDKTTFTEENKIKVLVIGNSFSRDWINVLLESENYKKVLDIVYVYGREPYTPYVDGIPRVADLWEEADYVFFSVITKPEYDSIIEKNNFDVSKTYIIGIKNFGLNNGLFYNRDKTSGYCDQRAKPKKGYIENNAVLKQTYGKNYIDIMGMLLDENNRMPVFSSDCMFLSEDGVHLTQSGAKYFSEVLAKNPEFILNQHIDSNNNKVE